MVVYVFDETVPRQDAVVSSSELDNSELELITSVVNWDSPNKSKDLIFEVSGRSVTFRSPTRKSTLEDLLVGKFDGLQLIGAGGNTFFVQNGFFAVPDTVTIYPVDQRNHAVQLRDITQLRRVNEKGEFEFSY